VDTLPTVPPALYDGIYICARQQEQEGLEGAPSDPAYARRYAGTAANKQAHRRQSPPVAASLAALIRPNATAIRSPLRKYVTQEQKKEKKKRRKKKKRKKERKERPGLRCRTPPQSSTPNRICSIVLAKKKKKKKDKARQDKTRQDKTGQDKDETRQVTVRSPTIPILSNLLLPSTQIRPSILPSSAVPIHPGIPPPHMHPDHGGARRQAQQYVHRIVYIYVHASQIGSHSARWVRRCPGRCVLGMYVVGMYVVCMYVCTYARNHAQTPAGRTQRRVKVR